MKVIIAVKSENLCQNVVLDSDKARLHQVKGDMEGYLSKLRLKLHPHKCQIFPVKAGTDFLGYQIFPSHRRVRKSSVTRARRRFKRLQRYRGYDTACM